MSSQLDNQAINENNNLTEPILPEGESTDNSIHQFETFEITRDSIGKNKKPRKIKYSQKISVSVFKLQFALCDSKDILMICIGIIASMLISANSVLFEFLLGNSINHLSSSIAKSTPEELKHIIWTDCKYYLILASGSLLAGYLYFTLWYLNGKRLSKKYRLEYFKLIGQQEQEWFDKHNPFELTTRIESETKNIEAALGLKIGFSIGTITMFFAGFGLCIYVNWKMTLLVSAICPILGFTIYKLAVKSAEFTEMTESEYGKAGAIAEESIYNIKTVYSFNNQKHEYDRYKEKMKSSFKIMVKKALIIASVYGVCEFLCHATEAGSIFFFTYLASKDKNVKIGDLFMIVDILLFEICMSLNEMLPCIKILDDACFSARKFFALKQRKQNMDFSSSFYKGGDNNVLYDNVSDNSFISQNKIEMKNVSFSYKNQNTPIFENLNLSFKPNKINALVGESGSGKSTIISLLMRLYDVSEGEILLNNVDVKQYEYEYLKDQFGYVQQEPMLMNTTIRENILMGRDGYGDDDIIKAAQITGALKVINSKPEKLDYLVGVKGSKLSGGEKQLIAITRAILAQPKFLILDEATSALDNKTEKMINKSISELSEKTTVIVIAHRLSSIIEADMIFVLDKGKVVSQGNHKELSESSDEYKQLILSMKNESNSEEEELEEEDNEEGNINIEKNNDLCKEDEIVSSDILIDTTDKKARRSTFIPKKPFFNDLDEIDINKFNNTRMSVRITNRTNHLDLSKEEFFSTADFFREGFQNNNIFTQLGKNPQPKKWLFSLMAKKKCLIISMILSSFLSGLIWPTAGYIIAFYGNKITEIIESTIIVTEETKKQYLKVGLEFFLVYLGVAIGIGTLCTWKNFNLDKMGGYISRKLRKETFKKYLTMHCEFFETKENSPSALLSKLAFDADNVNNIIFSSIGVIVESIITLVAAVGLGCIHNVYLTLLLLAFSPFMLLSMGFYFYIDTFETKEAEKMQILTGEILSEFINNIKTIKAFNFQQKLISSFQETIERNSYVVKKKTYLIGISYGISLLLSNVCYAFAFYVGGLMIANGKVSFGDFIQILMPFYLCLYYLSVAQCYIGDLTKANSSLKNLYEVHELKSNIKADFVNTLNIQDSASIKGDISFQNVSFSYTGNKKKKIISNFNLNIPYGKHIGIVGFSGSGKSTIIQLIERFFDSTQGIIKIDNKPITEYDVFSLRNLFGYVQQEPPLFNTSIIENIRYGNKSVSDDVIKEMLAEMKIEHLLQKKIEKSDDEKEKEKNNQNKNEEKNNGDDNVISGGEKQRVSIIRALVKKPKILLLDEATSSLDINLQNEIQKVINKYMEGKTMITVAHRLSTVIDCDEIIVMEKGKIIEKGKHEALLEKKGRYYELYQLNK